MNKKAFLLGQIIAVILLFIFASGCAVTLQKRHPSDAKRIKALTTEAGQLQRQLDRVSQASKAEIRELNQAKELLEKRLKKEIGDKNVRLDMVERGLVITLIDEVLFDSGKAKLNDKAYPVLDKVARVLSDQIEDRNIGVEGHTDNEPIKHSGWKSNWELSTARANSVLHYLVNNKKIIPERIFAIGYGEYMPVESNETKEGRQQNRRVEIVVFPQRITRLRAGEQAVVPEETPKPEEKVKKEYKK